MGKQKFRYRRTHKGKNPSLMPENGERVRGKAVASLDEKVVATLYFRARPPAFKF